MASAACVALEKEHAVVSSTQLSGDKSEWIIGRSLDSDINIPHSSVSRRHARIFSDSEGGFYLEDLKSTHGTTVAGSTLSEPVRLFDGLRISFGSSGFELVPTNMMAAVMAAMKAAQVAAAKREQVAAEAAQEAAEEAAGTAGAAGAAGAGRGAEAPTGESAAHRLGVALLAGGERGVAQAAAKEAKKEEEDDAMRSFLPMQFGKTQQQGGASLGAQHAANARDSGDVAAVAPLRAKGKRGKGGGPTIQIGKNIGASLGAGAGLAVPAATPTLAALQEARKAEAAVRPKPDGRMAPPPPKRIGASLPLRPPAGSSSGAGDGAGGDGDEEDEAGPPLPPGFGTAVAADDDDNDGDEAGPPLPPGFAAGASSSGTATVDDEVGPQLPPGFAGGGPLHGPKVGAYDPNDLSQQVMPDEHDGSSGDDDDEDGGGGAAGGGRGLRLPVSHQIVLKGHSKTVTCLALDKAGGRLVTGSSDHDVRLWDFGGMTSELRSFRHIQEPMGGYQLRSVDYSCDGSAIAVAGSSSQPVVLDREGRKVATLMKGDMYIRDMRTTRGHVAGCTGARWHPHDPNTLATASEDGTIRLWDIAVASARGADDMSLSVQSGQRGVMVVRDERGIKSVPGAIAWHADGNGIMCGARDGSLQMWEMRAPAEFKPVVLAKNATPRSEWQADKAKATQLVRGAHASGDDVSCVRWHRDGVRLASRSTDGTLKLWDLRRFDTPLAVWGSLPSIFPMTTCDFSPDGSLLVTGTSVKKGAGHASLTIVSTSSLEKVAEVPVDGASIVGLMWHPRINQLILGNADGGCYVLYDPDVSDKGALYCANKAPPKRSGLVYTGGAMQIHTPHALPMFKDEQLDHRKRRREERRDPLKSHKPEIVKSGPGTGGKLSVGYQQALLASLPGGVSGLSGTKDKIAAFKTEDPREEILKYAKLAAEDPHFVTPAYAVNQPATLSGQHLAKTVDSDDDDDEPPEKKTR
jgi:hypothetical protein